MAMKQFDEIKLLPGDVVLVKGSFSTEGMPLLHLRFVLAQGEEVVQGEAQASETTWRTEAPSGGLVGGKPVLATGIAVFRDGDAIQTITWSEMGVVEAAA
jgi:hypothetical protein